MVGTHTLRRTTNPNENAQDLHSSHVAPVKILKHVQLPLLHVPPFLQSLEPEHALQVSAAMSKQRSMAMPALAKYRELILVVNVFTFVYRLVEKQIAI